MADDFVILVRYGGLGDHLFHSHLPRIAKQHGGRRRVLVSSRSEFRDPAYRRLVWEANPFVDGFTDRDAPCPEFPSVGAGMNLLDRMMLERGLDDGLRFHEPELHHTPRFIPELMGRTVYDPNYVSYVGDVSEVRIEAFFRAQGTQPVQLEPRGRCCPVRSPASMMQTESLIHYCDVIHSCSRFCCLTSGGATLAAALARPAVAFFGVGQKPMFHHSRLHEYVDVSETFPRASAFDGAPARGREAATNE